MLDYRDKILKLSYSTKKNTQVVKCKELIQEELKIQDIKMWGVVLS
jgi:hypothetical protein